MHARTLPAMKKVESSNIEAIGHDHRGLVVRFKGGGVYRYPEADAAVHDEMLKAESIGGFFRDRVRGKFNHQKVDM